jgi:hypothetical protein
MKLVYFLVLLFSCHQVFGQDMVLDLAINKDSFLKLRGFASGDSAFLDVPQAAKPTSYWISPRGVRQVSLPEFQTFPFFAVGRTDSTYYYFVKEEKKKVFLSALVVKDGFQKLSKATVALQTRLFGHFVENGTLYLLTAEKSGYQLRLIGFEGLKQVADQVFSLSFDLGKFKKTGVSFYDGSATTMPSDVTKPIKIRKEKNVLWMTVDEIRNEYQQPPYPMNKTTVVRLDLQTGQSSTYIFSEESNAPFGSVVHSGILYRLVSGDPYRLDVFHIESGKRLQSHSKKQFSTDNAPVFWTVRNGASLFVTKTATKGFNVDWGSAFVMVDSVDQGGVLATLGVKQIKQSGFPIIAPSMVLGLAAALTVTLASAVIRELGEDSEIYQYVHFLFKDGEQKIFSTLATRRQRIDEYELEIRPTFKGYLHTSDESYGVYILSKYTQLKVVRFE